MKRFLGILLPMFLMVALMGCQNATAPIVDTAEPSATQTSSDEKPNERTEDYEAAYICISSDNGGFCVLMSGATIEYYNDKAVTIYISDPATLAFQVPENYTNGVGIVDGNDVLDIASKIRTHLATTDADEKTKELLLNIAQWLDSIALLTGAST